MFACLLSIVLLSVRVFLLAYRHTCVYIDTGIDIDIGIDIGTDMENDIDTDIDIEHC